MASSVESFGNEDTDGVTENAQKKKVDDNETGVGGGGDKRWPGWPGESVFRLLVPAQKVGAIIGKKGEFIKRMCEETRARIKIVDGVPGAPERAVIISAREEHAMPISPAIDGLLRVHKRVVDGLDGESGNSLPKASGMVSTRLLVAATQTGSLIGKQGATVKSIQEASNCIVHVLGPGTLEVTQHMQIPLSYADAVIGAAGSSISYIRRASGATVTIQESRGVPGEMTVEINGTAAQVQTAQQLIQNFMAEASGSTQNQVNPVDHAHDSYPQQGSMYSSPPSNLGLPNPPAGGYGSAYGGSYGF
ncbi:unnamed protein product [Victoria cruziana]